jgi:hypothetical protein
MADRIVPFLALFAGIALLVFGEASLAEGASEEDCRKFHQECSEAKAQGYRDVGICNVERLECRTDSTSDAEAGVGRTPRGLERPAGPDDREHSVGP